MNEIQVVFLFTSCQQLGADRRQMIKDVVQEEFRKVYRTGADQIRVELADGVSKDPQDEILFAIRKDVNSVNEALHRTRFIQAVAERMKGDPDMHRMGFTGRVRWQDGLLVPKTSGANQPGGGSQPKPAPEQREEKKGMPEDMMDYHNRAKMYQASEPAYTMEALKLPKETLEQIDHAIDRIRYEEEIFRDWGLYAIMPHPVSAMSFFGPAGTGKSMAAEAIASKLGKKIIRASYADIESKYVGEGPKNVSALFLAAEEQDAVLLIDEADSLLSKRLVNVQDSSGQAMNSMRSQLLISLEHFHGIVIFATNLVVNYDAAFISRLINVEFRMPDAEMRREIWEAHVLPRTSKGYTLNIPLAPDVDLGRLAEDYEMAGRDIRNSVVNACVIAQSQGRTTVDMECFRQGIREQRENARKALGAEDHTKVPLTSEEQKILAEGMQKKLDAKKAQETKQD